MASSYSELKIQLMATGENDGTWGDITNANFIAFQQMITGQGSVVFNNADVVLPFTDTNALQAARALRLNLSGSTGGPRTLTVPALPGGKQYNISNATADTITVKTPGGIGVDVPTQHNAMLWAVPGGVAYQTDYISNLTVQGLGVNGQLSVNGNLFVGGFIQAPLIQNNPTGIRLDSDNASFSEVVFNETQNKRFIYSFNTTVLYYGTNAVSVLSLDAAGNLAIAGAFTAAQVNVGTQIALLSSPSNSQLHMLAGPAMFWQANDSDNSLTWNNGNTQLFSCDQFGNFRINSNLFVATTLDTTNLSATNNVLAGNILGVNNPQGPYLFSDDAAFSNVTFHSSDSSLFHYDWASKFLSYYIGGNQKWVLDNGGGMTVQGTSYLRGPIVIPTSAGSPRFQINLTGGEAGGNVGNDLGFSAYDNAGNFLSTVCAIKRSTQRFITYGGQTTEVTSGAGGNYQWKIDGLTRWQWNIAGGAGNGDFSLYSLTTGGALASELVRYSLGAFTITYGNNARSIFLRGSNGGFFSIDNTIELRGPSSSIGFRAGATPLYFGAGDSDNTLYMGRTDGAYQFSFNCGNGIGTATTWNATSDERLKYNIAPLVSGLDALAALNPFTYLQTTTEQQAIDQVDGVFGAGIIAQQLIGTPFENLVVTPQPDPFGGETFYSFNYAGLTAWFIAAFKETKARLEDAEATIADLLARVIALENA